MSSANAWPEKALADRAVKRRLQAWQRQRCPPSGVRPSRRLRRLPHRTHDIAHLRMSDFRLASVLPTHVQQNQTECQTA
jgi:hypothetical protein